MTGRNHADGPLTLRIGTTTKRYDALATYIRYLSARTWNRLQHNDKENRDEQLVTVHEPDAYPGLHDDTVDGSAILELLR